jgi:hypothetical protein
MGRKLFCKFSNSVNSDSDILGFLGTPSKYHFERGSTAPVAKGASIGLAVVWQLAN